MKRYLMIALWLWAATARAGNGDVNGDGMTTIADANTVIAMILNGNETAAGDVNGDGLVTIADASVIVSIILNGEPGQTGYDYVWDDDALPEIHLEVSLDEWNRLLALYDNNRYTTQYVMARMRYVKDGQVTRLDSVGLRLKGNTSRRRPEGESGQMHQADATVWHHCHFGLNLRKWVNTDEHTLRGIRKLHLKWHKEDPSHVRELFCYDLFRRAGVWTALRDNYCRLWLHVEGDSQEVYYGVYDMLEPVDKRFLKDRAEQFGSVKGYLWKCRLAGCGLNNTEADMWWDDDSDDRHAYTLQTRTGEFTQAKAQLQDFITKLQSLSDTEFRTWIQQVTDVDLLLRTYAVNTAVGMWDDYWVLANNYYIYFNGTGTDDYRFFFIPYDYDNTLGTSAIIDAGRQDPLHWGQSQNNLIVRLLTFEDWKLRYCELLKQLVDPGQSLMDEAAARNRITAWQQLISPYVANGTDDYIQAVWDEPATWGNHSEYRLCSDDNNNFFRVKAASIAEYCDIEPTPVLDPWYVVGEAVADGSWHNSADSVGRSLIPMYPHPDSLHLMAWAGYLEADKGFKVVHTPGRWDSQWGVDASGNLVLNGGLSNDITVSESGYYRLDLDSRANALTINRITDEVATYTLMCMPGRYQGWDPAQNAMTTVTTVAPGHDWTADMTWNEDTQLKFAANGSWAINWGARTFPAGLGTQDGPNIPVAAGAYRICFNDLLGRYLFLPLP